MTRCFVSEQIAKHCNESAEPNAEELLEQLLDEDCVVIQGDQFTFDEVLNLIDFESMKFAVMDHVCGDKDAINKMIVKKIEGLM